MKMLLFVTMLLGLSISAYANEAATAPVEGAAVEVQSEEEVIKAKKEVVEEEEATQEQQAQEQ